jgi:hypothetical protein
MTEQLPVAELTAALASALLGLDDGAPLTVVVQLPDGRTASVVEVLHHPDEGLLELRTGRRTDRPAYRSPTGRLNRDYDFYRSAANWDNEAHNEVRRRRDDLLERQLRDYRPGGASVEFPLDEEIHRLFYGPPTSADPLRDVRAEPEPEQPS